MRSQKKNVAMLCLFYFLSYIAFVLPYGYMQTFLEYVGYDVVERGIILSGTAVVAIITQFFIGYLCDKYKTDKKFFNLCLIVFVLSTLVMYQVTQRQFLSASDFYISGRRYVSYHAGCTGYLDIGDK
ncbi:MAG: MFS transporter [[Clostridium] innocuum]